MRTLSLVVLLALVAGCAEPRYTPGIFVITPGTLARSGDTVIAQAYLGPNGCYRFHHREMTETDSTLTLKYFGVHNEGPAPSALRPSSILTTG